MCESEETRFTRKIARGVAHIKRQMQDYLYLGNPDVLRDWGYAKEYVEAMWLMLQQDEPDDFVIGTGETHSIREFAESAFSHVDLDWQDFVRFDPRYCRPAEVDALCASPLKARQVLKWSHRVGFRELVELMVDAEFVGAGQPKEVKLHLSDRFS
jgi:GDPmannose 4,6-dehydratase